MSVPYRCSVCDGRGKVPVDFYMLDGTYSTATTSAEPETCRTCWGVGVIWPPVPPYPIPDSVDDIKHSPPAKFNWAHF